MSPKLVPKDTPQFNGVKLINPDTENPRTVTVGVATVRGEAAVNSYALEVPAGGTVNWTPTFMVNGVTAIYVSIADGSGHAVDFGAWGVGRKREGDDPQYIVNAQVTWENPGPDELTIVSIMEQHDPDAILRRATQGKLTLQQKQSAQYVVPKAHTNLALQLPFLPPTSVESPRPVYMGNGIVQGVFSTAEEQQVAKWSLAEFSSEGPSPQAQLFSLVSGYVDAELGAPMLLQWSNGSPQEPGMAGEYVVAQSGGTLDAQAWRFIYYETFDGSTTATPEGYQIVNVGGSMLLDPYRNDSALGAGYVLISPSSVSGVQCVYMPPDSASGSQSQFWDLQSAG